jgi:natural product precursor
MIRNKKRLGLKNETIKHLSSQELRAAAGGQTILRCTTDCSDIRCPTTQFNEGCNSNTDHC